MSDTRKRSLVLGAAVALASVGAITGLIFGLREFVPVVSTGVVYVAPPGSPPRGGEREALESLRRLAAILEAQLPVEEDDEVAEAAARVAAERGRPTC